MRTLANKIAKLFVAAENCRTSGNGEWQDRHTMTLNALVKDHMPSGSGFDSGTQFDWGKSKEDRLVFNTSFHHMAESGMYDGWTEHDVVVTPSLSRGFDVRVTGRDRNSIKDYIGETFHGVLSEEVE
jgi:hypothetical protein